MENVTCASISVSIPLGTFVFENIVNSEIPITISGITTGIYSSPSIRLFPLNLYLYIPIAPSVPTIVARIVLVSAINIVFPKELNKASLSNNLMYQSKVKPFHERYGFVVVAFIELTTITEIGRKRKIYTAAQKTILPAFLIFAFCLFFIHQPPRLSISPPIFW